MTTVLLLSACGTKAPSESDSPPATSQPPATSTPAPAPDAAKPATEIDRTLTIAGSSLRFSKMNPLYVMTDGQLQFYPYMWMGLGRQEADGTMTPWLAQSTVLSDDCTTVTITLHKQAKWSDGKPITSEDVAFTYHLANHPKLVDPGVGSWVTEGTQRILGAKEFHEGKTNSIEGVKIIDEHTVELTLAPSDCRWDQNMHMLVNGIQPKHILEPLWDELDTHPYMDEPVVTSGPYRLVKFEVDQFAELERVEDWWGNDIYGKPGIKKYAVVQFTSGAAPRHAQLEAGELHVGGVDGQELERFLTFNHVDVVLHPSVGARMLIMNTRKPYMTPQVRQAISYAIDWDAVMNLAHFGLGQIVATPIFGPDWAVDPNLAPRTYDPAKAKELLQAANWDPNTKMVYLTTSAEDKLPEVIQQNLKDVGMQLEIQVASTQQRNDRWNAGDYDMSGSGGGVIGQDPGVICGYFTPDALHTAWTGWTNQEFYDLCGQINSTTHQPTRQGISYALQKILYEELPWINYGRAESAFVVDKRIGGFTPNVVSINRSAISLMDWYWKE